MANNTILTPRMAGILEQPMADPTTPPEFPRYGFSATEPGDPVKDSVTGATTCNSRLFANQAELDAAGGTAVWHATPAEAAVPPPPSGTGATTEEGDEPHARRSHR